VLRRHPILGSIVIALLSFAAFIYYVAHDGMVTLPTGDTADLAMAWQTMQGVYQDPLDETTLRQRMRLPAGFTIETWATGLGSVRMLYVTPAGDLLVSQPRTGQITLIRRDANGAAAPGGSEVLLAGLDRPHGIDWHAGWLYIGEGSAVARVRFDPATRSISGAPEQIVTGLPEGGSHWTRTLHVGPDEMLYVSVGSSCNVCEEKDARRAALLRYTLDGRDEEIYASGLRNAVDFAWHPESGELYATDNGRDLLGNDFPPCEINRVERGGFYGWPYVNGSGVADPDFGKRNPARLAVSRGPAHELPAHSAPLGIAFYAGDAFPAEYRNAAFVALHGSWNRSRKQGYEVVSVHFDSAGGSRREPFLSGFVVDEQVSGRPVGVAVGPAGELFVSDDYTGSVYRIAYGEAPRAGGGMPVRAARAMGDPLAAVSTEDRQSAVAHGAALWDANRCASCHVHGVEGAEPSLLGDLSQHFDLNAMLLFLRAPQPPMPLYSFDDTERRDLAIYLFDRFSGE
jgi:glucose/arabinose dehydrogenase